MFNGQSEGAEFPYRHPAPAVSSYTPPTPKPLVYEDGWYGTGRFGWTVFCKMPGDGRGIYSEEIDVRTRVRSVAAAKKVAQQAIEVDYDKQLRPSRVVHRPEGFMF